MAIANDFALMVLVMSHIIDEDVKNDHDDIAFINLLVSLDPSHRHHSNLEHGIVIDHQTYLVK